MPTRTNFGGCSTSGCKFSHSTLNLSPALPWKFPRPQGAEGHAPHALTIDVPHRGEWAGVRVRLETWRARALALFRDVATDALPGMPFDERTLRELQGDTSVPADVRALGRAVERAFYAADAPDASLVAELERRARAILEGARARREDAR